ncbi:MAG: hypothetical protein CVV64_06895 [Candidatus Wallbacteria bacterium HGW-Wallbacteria-1]|jgi:hypothetical protein|uniref:Uncharacterized protein n=1 Tax=Candidatus Wallbacteria bacterium HGW-Wallbacteria-1 TaxID=2013854 RepID=A0A2N1PT24_9BACT|nr:MAG: hypothetical protein CVV64_06895 [Candidatus Wallbacteria bacterium HGW-Wallbacteria-1]
MLSWIFTSEGVGELLISLQIFLAGFLTYSVVYALQNLFIWQDDEEEVLLPHGSAGSATSADSNLKPPDSHEVSHRYSKPDELAESSETAEQSVGSAESGISFESDAQSEILNSDSGQATIETHPSGTGFSDDFSISSQYQIPDSPSLNPESPPQVQPLPGTILYREKRPDVRSSDTPRKEFSGLWLGMDNLANRLESLGSKLDELNVATVRNVASGFPVLGRRKRRKQLEAMAIEEVEEMARVVSCGPFRSSATRRAMTCLAQMERYVAKKNYSSALEELANLSELIRAESCRGEADGEEK